MKNRFLFLAFAALAAIAAQANPVDSEQAKQLGLLFMKNSVSLRSCQLDLAYAATTEQGPAFYVFSVQPKGFVIVSADDRMRPILGYSTESNFSPDHVEAGLLTFFDNYKAGYCQMVANNDVRSEQAVDDWTRLSKTGKINDSRITRAVPPLCASIWNQTDLYNDMAPEDPSSVFSGHCKSGCVANAMSQLMRYWEWPRQGQGSHSYYASSYYGDYGYQYANFGEATYRFELMPDFLDFASPQAEVDATALLEYHAGVGVDMGYGANASGAYSSDVPSALMDYFRYSDDMQLRYKGGQWEDDLRTNLDAGMPFYYASSGPDGGHAYILDGYDDNNMFHLNWGWAGFDNGYYAIDAFYLTYYSFPWSHEALFNVHPSAVYYNAPKAVENLQTADLGSMQVSVTFNPVYYTRNDIPLSQLDTVVIMRDGNILDVLTDVNDMEVVFHDQVEKNGTYYYTVYAVNEAGMSKVSRDTVMVGNTCDLRFDLHDTGNNGWDMSFVAVLDEDGKVSRRVGLWDGAEASLVLPVPSDQTATFFWTYDNTCYSHGSLSEASYEIYDWDDQLIYASDGYPVVGEIIDYEMGCGLDCRPVADLDGVYQWNGADEFGVVLTWQWNGDVETFKSFNVYCNDERIAQLEDAAASSYFQLLPELGAALYGVTVSYESGEETCESEIVSVVVEVTGVMEKSNLVLYPNPTSSWFNMPDDAEKVAVYDALGQVVYCGEEKSVSVSGWKRGVYFVHVDRGSRIDLVKLLVK